MGKAVILASFASVVAVAALAVSIFTLVSSMSVAESEDESIHLADRGEFTVDQVKQALKRYDKEGREATVRYYNSPESVNGEWYVFILDEDDRIIAHAVPEQLGRDLKGDLGVDSAGYRFGDVMLEAGEDGLWVDYLFLNPNTGNQEYKHSWVVRHDGLLFGSGWYQILPKLE